MGSTPTVRCNRCRCNVPEEDRYSHQCSSVYEEYKNGPETVRRNNQQQTNRKHSDNKFCKHCRKYIIISEYDDHMLCHNLNNENDSNTQEIMTNNGHRYKIIYSINLRNGSNIRNTRHNRVEISIPNNNINSHQPITATSQINTARNQIEQLNSIRNITNLLRQCIYNYYIVNNTSNNEITEAHNLLDVLPETILENVSKLPEEKKSCVICLSNYEIGDKVLTIPCYHIFHTNCIKNWLKSKNNCPICKFKIDNNSLDMN